MKVQFNTDKNIQSTENSEMFVSETNNHKLQRFTN